jgi:hypothetical protein
MKYVLDEVCIELDEPARWLVQGERRGREARLGTLRQVAAACGRGVPPVRRPTRRGRPFAVVETGNPTDILDASAKFAPLKVFNVYPVVDMTEWAQKLQEGVEFRESIG